MTNKYESIISLLDHASHWVIIAHSKPDGDTLGSAAALARAAKRMSKQYVIGCSDKIPERFAFLVDGLEHRVMKNMQVDAPKDSTVVICVDTSTISRSVDGLLESGYTVLNIDHHIDNERFGDHHIIEDDASSTGEVVARLMLASQWGLEKAEAEALYAAMVTDNGNFSYASTSVKSHECAIALLRAGAHPDEISARLSSNISLGTLRLWAAAYSHIEIISDGRGAMMHITNDDLKETGTTRDDLENIVNDLLRIKGVGIAALASPTYDGKTKISVRSRSPYSAHSLAKRFGGGGHELASGCTIDIPIASALKTLKKEMEEQILSTRI